MIRSKSLNISSLILTKSKLNLNAYVIFNTNPRVKGVVLRRYSGRPWEVVRELKDVIWKVGEQRRMREQRQRAEGEELDRAARADDVFTSLVRGWMISHLGHTIIQIRAVTGKTSQADKQAKQNQINRIKKKKNERKKEQAEKHCSNSDK